MRKVVSSAFAFTNGPSFIHPSPTIEMCMKSGNVTRDTDGKYYLYVNIANYNIISLGNKGLRFVNANRDDFRQVANGDRHLIIDGVDLV